MEKGKVANPCHRVYMALNRKPTLQEELLLEFLLKKSFQKVVKNWKEGLLVRPMDDGEMGSLLLFPRGEIIENRTLGEQVSDFQFTDTDGVEVIASLNLDSKGNLFELDVLKADFSPLIKFPEL